MYQKLFFKYIWLQVYGRVLAICGKPVQPVRRRLAARRGAAAYRDDLSGRHLMHAKVMGDNHSLIVTRQPDSAINRQTTAKK